METTNEVLIIELNKLIKELPNDYDLGEKIRSFVTGFNETLVITQEKNVL